MCLNEFLDPKNGKFNICFIILPSEIKILKKIIKRDQCSLAKGHRVAKISNLNNSKTPGDIFKIFFLIFGFFQGL